MYREALVQLRRVIANVPEHRLHMRRVAEKTKCGTAHCAAGWAATDPWFINHPGFLYRVVHGMQYEGDELIEARMDFKSASEFFGLTECDTNWLFGGELCCYGTAHCVSKREVLDNIDRLLRGEHAELYKCQLRKKTVKLT